MKKLVIIVLAILILVGGTVTAMKWLALGPFEVEETGEEKTEPKEEAILIDMEPIVLQVFLEGQIAATIQFQMKLETAGQVNASFPNGQVGASQRRLCAGLARLLTAFVKKEKTRRNRCKRSAEVDWGTAFGKGLYRWRQIQSATEKPSI